MSVDREMMTKKHRDLAQYMSFKYGGDYMSAISKLNAKDAYDEKGYLKMEYALTDKERDALHFYVPEVVEILGTEDLEKPRLK